MPLDPQYSGASTFMKAHIVALALCIPAFLVAAERPYDPTADAAAEIAEAVEKAASRGASVIVVFGANWCTDCLVLDKAMTEGATGKLLARDFEIVKVDVGDWDTNLDIADGYGVPVKMGIPTVAVLSPQNEVLLVTRSGELANARSMEEDGIHAFFRKVTAATKRAD